MSTLQKLIAECDLSTEENRRLNEELRLLMSCAVANAKLGEIAITDRLKTQPPDQNLYLPIANIIESISETHAVTTEDSAAITRRVKESLKRFYDPNDDAVLNGFASLLTDALTGLMGEGRGMEAQQDIHLVGLEGLGFIRLDFAIWVQNLETIGIRKKCQHAVSVVAVKSAIDVSKMELATFLVLYGRILERGYNHDMARFIARIKDAKQVFIQLGGSLPQSQTQTSGLPSSETSSIPPIYCFDSPNRGSKTRRNKENRPSYNKSPFCRRGQFPPPAQEGIVERLQSLEKENDTISDSTVGRKQSPSPKLAINPDFLNDLNQTQPKLLEAMPGLLHDLGIISLPRVEIKSPIPSDSIDKFQSSQFTRASVKADATSYPFLIRGTDMFGKISVNKIGDSII